MTNIVIGTGYDPRLTHRWAFVYLDGEIENVMGCDVFMANVPKPEPGQHEVTFQTDGDAAFRCIATIYPEAHHDYPEGRVNLLEEFCI